MININFKKLDKQRKIKGLSKSELARRVGMEPTSYLKFVKSGKQLRQHLNIVDKLCKVVGLNWHDVIK